MRLSLIAPALLAVAVCACGSTTTAALPSPTPSPSPAPLTCTSAGPASADWPAPGTSPTPYVVSVSVSGDILTMTFSKGTPAFTVTTQSNAHFTKDPSGQPLDVPGNAGAVLRLTGFTMGDQPNFAGKVTTTTAGPLLLDVNPIGDFEGVLSFAAGLEKAGCANVTSSGSTLTFHFIPSS